MSLEYLTFNCNDLQESFSYLISSNNREVKLVLKFKIIISNFYEKITQRNLKKLNKWFRKNSVIILYEDANEKKFGILWKSSKIKQLLFLQSDKEFLTKDDKLLIEFIAVFFETCLHSGYLGIQKNQSSIRKQFEITLDLIADSRNYNLLFLACESGNLPVVETLLKYGISSDSLETNLQDLAWQGQHSDVILKLLSKNLPYPKSIDVNECSENLKKFINISIEFHESIKCKNRQRLDEILSLYPKLYYFYSLSNESALKIALDSRDMKIYEFLVARNLKFADHENTDTIFESLNLTYKEDLNAIHVKYLKDLPEKHINILLANTSLSHDENDEEGKMKLVQNAFRVLNKEPKIKIILQIIAASKKFHIVFDFYRDSTYRIDPTTSAHTTGIFYFTGRILIGAKQLLQPETEYEAFGTLAHELCHCAMNILYENKSNPYPPKDRKAIENFENISQICKDKKDAEKIIKFVFENYPKNQQHSELIVRPVHMMAHYMSEPEVLEQKRMIFIEIFNHFENVIIPAMEAILPEIEERLTYKPTFVYNKLSDLNQKKVQNAIVKYKNVKLKFCELFSCDSVPYEKLTPEHIAQFLDNKVLNLNDPHMHYIDKLVTFEWRNLTEKLKQKFLSSNLNFQNVKVKFKNLENSCSKAFNSLTSEQIIKIISGNTIDIGEKFVPESEFYVDRKFMPEDGRQIFFDYEYGHEYNHNKYIEEEHKKTRQIFLNKSFEEFTHDFLSQDLETRTKIIDKIKQNYLYKIRYYDLSGDYIKCLHRNMCDIIQQTETEKIFILSSEAGAGKTVSFEHLTIQTKSQYPTRWVSFIDLKDHTKFYIPLLHNFGHFFNKIENIENLLRSILGLSDKKSTLSNNDFETNIFSESFESGNMIILWNGFDEISPTYNEFILTLIKFIYENTKIIQYVCTRPLYCKQLSDAFKLRPWQLVPFNEDEKVNFLNKFFISKKVEEQLIANFVSNVLKIVKKFEFQHKVFRDFNTPLILKLVAEIYEDEKLFESANLYGIFETFVRKKVRIWIEKSEFARKTSENLIIKSSKFSIIEIFQKFAFFREFRILSGTTLGLKLKKLQFMQKKIPKDLPFEEISRIGILYIDGENKFEFSHRTFGEFFIAQYFIENIYLADDDVNIDEAELRLEIFFRMSNEYGFLKIIIDFMDYYLKIGNEDDNKILSETFSELLRTKFKRVMMNLLNTNHPEIFRFLFEFFKRDHDLLVELLHVYQKETFYTAIFNPNNFAVVLNPQEVKSLAQKYLSQNELEYFLTGKNQKGTILTGIHFYESLGIIKTNYEFSLNSFGNKVHIFDLIKEIKGKLTLEEQKELFLTFMSPKIYLYFNEKVFKFSDDIVELNDNDKLSLGCPADFASSTSAGLVQNLKSFFNHSKVLPSKSVKYAFETSNSTKSSKFKNDLKIDEHVSSYNMRTAKSSNMPSNSDHVVKKSIFFEPTLKTSTNSNSHNKIHESISINSDNLKFKFFWETFENLFTSEEIKIAIGNSIMDYLEIYGCKKSAGNFFLSFLLNKCEQFLTDSQIFEIFLSRNIMHEAGRGNFEVMWNFLCKHTTKDERKEILLQDNENDDKNFYFYYYAEMEIKKNFSNYPYYYYHYDFTPFKVFHRIMTVPDAASFDFIKNIYLEHFRKTEIQKIILSSNDFLYYLIGRVLEGPCRKFVALLEEIFDGNKKLLKEYLDRKIKPTNLTIFQYFNDFKGTNETLYFENLKIFIDLYEKISK
ncbi:hypothetical protein ACKWTF_016776 [Chironomus riparius]